MAQRDVLDFLDALEADTGLQQAFEANLPATADEAAFHEALAATARAAGYAVAAEDVGAAIAGAQQLAGDGELSDSALDSVSGGSFWKSLGTHLAVIYTGGFALLNKDIRSTYAKMIDF